MKPEALRLADALDSVTSPGPVSAELRRLHQSEREAWRYAAELEQERLRLRSENDSLKNALFQAQEAAKDLAEKTDKQFGQLTWAYGELKREQLANLGKTSLSLEDAVAIVVDPYDTPGLQWLCRTPPIRGDRLYLRASKKEQP